MKFRESTNEEKPEQLLNKLCIHVSKLNICWHTAVSCLHLIIMTISYVLKLINLLRLRLKTYAKFSFSRTNSVVQNNTLLLLHGALASNRFDIRGLLTISRYMWCYLDVLLVFLHLAIAFK